MIRCSVLTIYGPVLAFACLPKLQQKWLTTTITDVSTITVTGTSTSTTTMIASTSTSAGSTTSTINITTCRSPAPCQVTSSHAIKRLGGKRMAGFQGGGYSCDSLGF